MLSRLSGLIGCSLLLLPAVTIPAEEERTPNSDPQNRNEREKPEQEVVRIPAGTYPLDDIVTKGGTAERWVRYVAAQPGRVILRGGGRVDKPYVIVDGFTVDAKLDPRHPEIGGGLGVETSHVVIANCEIIGPNEVHTGYDTDDSLSGKEYSSGMRGGGGGVRKGSKNVTYRNCVIHGFNNAMSFHEDTEVKIEKCLLRNSFNGISFSGSSMEVVDSVMWTHPNHQFSIKNPSGEGVVRLHNNLFLDVQDMIKAGANWSGCAELYVTHNTFYTPNNRPFSTSGLQLNRVRKKVVVKDNIIVARGCGSFNANARIESDYNLYSSERSEQFTLSSLNPADIVTGSPTKELTPAQWRVKTNQDNHSLFGREPLFADAPAFTKPLPGPPGNEENQWGFWVPTSREAARARFRLKPGSSGRNAASDGKHLGILPD